MTARARLSGHRERGAALAAALALHALLAALLLLIRPTLPAAVDQRPLAVFDAVIPPPPPEIFAAAAEPERPTAPGGGGTARAVLPAPVPTPMPAQRETIDLTPLVTAPPEVALDTSGLATSTLGAVAAGLEGGAGVGTGVDGGRGDGAGLGSGLGDGPKWLPGRWLRQPTNAEFRRVWPTMARRQRLNGDVRLSCQVDRSNRARRCRVLDERPRNEGFGRAALALQSTFRIHPITRDGQHTDLPVRFNVLFRHAPTTPAPAP